MISTKVERTRRRPVAVIEETIDEEFEPNLLDWVWFDTDPAARWNDESQEDGAVPGEVWDRDDAWWANRPATVGRNEERSEE